MSRVVVVEKNKDGKIEFTKEELQKMLDDAYCQGYADGSRKYDTITYPSWISTVTNDPTIPMNNHLNKHDVTVKCE